ncbi:hypothetical protein LTR09_001584 [Extremus antarcticus]|uniref:Uncharacterized protein n=1 Tax=Extremus antarcticus TaxID=702011 RepID=A0AAJ0GH38_9PEZI|nr:hypothetical protein LTR09_001584 [Extremus antarcticus]
MVSMDSNVSQYMAQLGFLPVGENHTNSGPHGDFKIDVEPPRAERSRLFSDLKLLHTEEVSRLHHECEHEARTLDIGRSELVKASEANNEWLSGTEAMLSLTNQADSQRETQWETDRMSLETLLDDAQAAQEQVAHSFKKLDAIKQKMEAARQRQIASIERVGLGTHSLAHSIESAAASTGAIPSHDSSTGTPSLLEEYYDRKGDVGVIRESLLELERDYHGGLSGRDLSKYKGEILLLSDHEYESAYRSKRDKLEQALLQAEGDVDALCRDLTKTGQLDPHSRLSYRFWETAPTPARSPTPVSHGPKFDPDIVCQINGVRTSCFPDTGAGANYMSPACAKKYGVEIDKTRTSYVKVANGGKIKSVGSVVVQLGFMNEATLHPVEFVVLPKCRQKPIFGSPFLSLTKTLTRYRHRITRILRNAISCRVQYLGAPRQLVYGTLDGNAVLALPDTGSDVMLLSSAYVARHGLTVDPAASHQRMLDYADGSSSRTSGMVHGLQWRYGDSLDEIYSADFYVLDDLQCDVLLSYDFLEATQAYTAHENAFLDVDEADVLDDCDSLCTVVLRPEISTKLKLRNLFSKSKGPTNEELQALDASTSTGSRPLNDQTWSERRRRLLQRKEDNESAALRLPPSDRQATLARFKKQWEIDWIALMCQQPLEMQQADGAGTSS